MVHPQSYSSSFDVGLLSAALWTTVERREKTRLAGPPTIERSDQRICLLAALAVAASIVYGSLVPFDLRWSKGLSLRGLLAQLQFRPWSLASAGDLLVNIAVGLSLGFVLTGAIRAGRRRSAVAAATTVLLVGCISAMLGLVLELLQVLSPTRESSWNDVWAQALGAGLGALAWTLAGPALMQWRRDAASERASYPFAVRLLQLYLPIYLLLQLTPFDSGRTAALATKYAGDAVRPSAEPVDATFAALLDLAGEALLAVPIGVLAALGWVTRGTRRGVVRAVLLGALVILTVGIAQEVLWRRASVSELIAGTVGVMIGVVAARALPRAGVRSPSGQTHLHRWFLGAAAAWTLVLVVHAWYPFDFALTSEIVTRRLNRISLVPFGFYYWYAAYIVNPLGAVHETVLNFVLAVPLGSFLRLGWSVGDEPRIRRFQRTATVSFAIAVPFGIELGQAFLPMRSPDVTDALIGTIGTLTGIAAVHAFAWRRSTECA